MGHAAQLAGEPDLAEAGQIGRCSPGSPRAATPRAALATARATARSAPGSSTRTPPATLTKTSALPTPTPAWRPSTASTSASRLRSIPLAIRRGGTSSDGETSACTSTSSGREPSIAASTTLPGARVASPTKRALASSDLDEAALAHLEHAGLVRRAEAVLERAQRAVGPLALALELQHAVDEVLEHARAGQRALLGHVADEQHGDGARLGEPRDAVGDLAHLADDAGRAREVAGVQGLHRVDDADLGPLGLERGEHRVEVRLREHRDLERRARQPLGAQLDLRRATPRPRRRACAAPRPRGCRAPSR